MREYLIECTTKKCDSTLQHNLLDAMVKVLWRIENGLGARPDPKVSEPPLPPMCPKFYASCVSSEAKGERRMGLEQWWQSYGITHRARHCSKASRCGLAASAKQAKKPGFPLKCGHCTFMKNRMPCACADCKKEKEAAATSFGTKAI